MGNSSGSNKNRLLNPEKWLEKHGNYLFRFALGRLRNTEIAENVVQETFLAALKANKTFSGLSSERTWLIGILKHKIIDHFRKSYREVPITNIEADQNAIDSFFDRAEMPHKFPSNWIPDAHNLMENNEFWETLENCIKRLPKHTSDAFCLREIDNMSTKEICKILGITPTNLWVILHRARLQLRGCLEENWFKE